MNVPDRERWTELWRRAGARSDPAAWHDQLAALYSQPHRHYHHFGHIADCLREFDAVHQLAADPVAVEIAIWFHDAIYDPRAADNEERSADLARQCLAAAGVGQKFSNSVAPLVLATKLHDVAGHPDAPLLVDVDLSILGQPAERFWQYEREIRAEYAWVPETVFTAKRAEILDRFLSRPNLYATNYFREKYESTARENLKASVRKLRGG